MKTILLNAMFAGTFGEKNIDGEIINFYLDDNGTQNYFIPEYGYLPDSVISNNMVAILMISKIDGYTFEVIGKYVPGANGSYVAHSIKHDIQISNDFISQNHITYGGIPLNDIYATNTSVAKNFSLISYRGGTVYFLPPQKRIILTGSYESAMRDFSNDNTDIYELKEYSLAKWGSKNYRVFSKDNNGCYKNSTHCTDLNNTYDILEEIVNNDIWITGNSKYTVDISMLDKIRNVDYLGINHIMEGSHVELLSSNWLAHYINMSPENFIEFFGLSNPGRLVSVKREKENIDILVEFENIIIVVENKIKSSIVENSSGFSCQLEKYYNYIESNFTKAKKYIVLCPDYKKRQIENQIAVIKSNNPLSSVALDSYIIKTYSELKSNCLKHTNLSYARYYIDLIDFIDDHSTLCEHDKKKKLSEKRFSHNIAIKL